MQLDHDLHVAADGVADLLRTAPVPCRDRQRDAGAVRGLGGDVERPDLHRADAFGRAGFWRGRRHCSARRAGPRRDLRSKSPGFSDQSSVALEQGVLLGGADMPVAGAGVVDRHALVGAPAEQPPDRLAERLAVDVPERDVDGGVAAHLGAGIAGADIDAAERAVVQFDVARVLAEQIGGDVVVDVGWRPDPAPRRSRRCRRCRHRCGRAARTGTEIPRAAAFRPRRPSSLLLSAAHDSAASTRCALTGHLWYRYQNRQDGCREGAA